MKPRTEAPLSPVWVPIVLFGLLGCLTWSFWETLAEIADKWAHNPLYSHGFFVPLFALVVIWSRLGRFELRRPGGSTWGLPALLAATGLWLAGVSYQILPLGAVSLLLGFGIVFLLLKDGTLDLRGLRLSWRGLPFLVFGLGVRHIGSHFYFQWFEFVSLVPCMLGICLLAGGGRALRWAWPAVAFTVFMIPLPYTVERMMHGPLQSIATRASTFLMQTAGLPALASGYVVRVNDIPINVFEACSGLGMLITFFALSAAVAILIERPLWQRGVVLLSAVPIAVAANVLRITATGILHVALADRVVFGMEGHEFAARVFHDWAGWLMPLVALVLLGLELWVLERLVIVEEDRPLVAGLAEPAKSRGQRPEISGQTHHPSPALSPLTSDH